MAACRVLVYFYLFFVYIRSEAAEELTAEVVFDVLSRRLDYVVREIGTVKSNVADIELDVQRIVKRIDNIETNVTDIIKLTHQKDDGISKSVMPNKLKRQSKALQKMLATEKTILRETVDQFRNLFSKFQSDIKSQFLSMNFSVGNSIENLEQTVSYHKTDINATLLEMMTETDSRFEEISQEVKEASSDALNSIIEVEKSMKVKTKSDVENAKNEVRSRLNSEIAKVTTKLNVLEREQERQEDDIDGHISDLKRRISAEEATKVAFSAILHTKRSYYGKDQRIVFDEVIYSHGGGFDSSTGIFTAPKSGTYLFTYNIESTSKGKAHVVLNVRGFMNTRAIAEKDTDGSGANAGIAYLWKDDKAWIETASLQSKYYIWPYRTTFNGILID